MLWNMQMAFAILPFTVRADILERGQHGQILLHMHYSPMAISLHDAGKQWFSIMLCLHIPEANSAADSNSS